MASSSSLQPWKLMSLMLIMMIIMAASSYAPVVKGFQPSEWMPSHATFYDDDDSGAQTTMGEGCGYGNVAREGCGYGNLMTDVYGTDTAALSSVLFNSGQACGECFQIKCTQTKDCYSAIVTVTATDLCPPNWGEDSNNGGWCNPPRTHFDMAKSAFNKIAFGHDGILPILYRRVACVRLGGLRFSFHGNPYQVIVSVMNVGGAGDIASMYIKGTDAGWIGMSHLRGASYQAFAALPGQALSFMVTSYTTKETIIASNVAPSNWRVGETYSSTVNFHDNSNGHETLMREHLGHAYPMHVTIGS